MKFGNERLRLLAIVRKYDKLARAAEEFVQQNKHLITQPTPVLRRFENSRGKKRTRAQQRSARRKSAR
jgi:hypothetical protein